MRPLPLLLPASLLAFAATASAQNLPYPQADSTTPSTVQVTAPARNFRLTDEQEQYVAGAYAMSNGWRLDVRTSPQHIEATIDGRKPMRLVALSPDKFVSRDGNVSMEFNRGPTGDDMVMSYRPDPRLAQVIVLTTRLAQR
jgi:hypothetical protein